MEETPKVIYSSYTDAQKRATIKYREANKEKVNAQRKKYYESRKEKDPDFLQYKRDKAKEYYLKKKEMCTSGPQTVEVDELVTIDVPEETEEPQKQEDTIEEHWEKKSQAHIQSPDEEKPPLAWSNDEIIEPVDDIKPEKKARKARVPKVKPNLTLEDLQELLSNPDPLIVKTPKTPKSRKAAVMEVLDSA